MLLHMCLDTWQDHNATIPIPMEMEMEAEGEMRKESERVRIPMQVKSQKKQVEKHCTLCQKHGGAPSSNNTVECTTYKKDGTMKSTWGTGKSPGKLSNKKDDKVFVQLAKSVTKFEKALKKAGRVSSKRRSITMTVTVVPIPNRKLG